MAEGGRTAPEVSVVIVTWNAADFIGACLGSVLRWAPPGGRDLEVIVADNGSTDGTAALIRREFPQVRLIPLPANHGFAPACNAGLQAASGRYLMLLNPDARFENDAAGALRDFLAGRPEAGAAGPCLIDPSGALNLFAVRRFPSLAEALATQFGLRMLTRRSGLRAAGIDPAAGVAPRPVPCLSGAALMMPREVWERVGPLSEAIPMYFEDIDLCRRIAGLGRGLYYVPTAVIRHWDGKSAAVHPRRPTLIALEKGEAPRLFFQTYQGALAARLFRAAVLVGSLGRLLFFGSLAPAAATAGGRPGGWVREGLQSAAALLLWSLTPTARFHLHVGRIFPPRPVPPAPPRARPGGRPPIGASPTVSVLVHNRNRAGHLARCLESVAGQRWRPLEVVVLDAGSTDGSSEVIARYRRRFAALGIAMRFIPCEPAGVAASRNLAARWATGAILCFLDNDGRLESPEALGRAVAHFRAHPELAVVTFRILASDTAAIDPFTWVHRRPAGRWQHAAFRTFAFTGGGFAIRADAFRDGGMFWERLPYSREEEDLAYALIDRGWGILYAPDVVFRHYAEPSGRLETGRRRAVELKNGLMVLYRRLPLPIAWAAMLGRVATMSLAWLRRERRLPRELAAALPEALAAWRDPATAGRRPIGYRAVARIAALHLARDRTDWRPDHALP